MRPRLHRLAFAFGLLLAASAGAGATPPQRSGYPWGPTSREGLSDRFPAPAGFARTVLPPGSFGAWLRALPLRPAGAAVHAFDGTEVRAARDGRIAAVADLDVGPRDLQQCADSILRLHAEWLWASGRQEEVAYRLTSGELLPWTRFAAGERPQIGRQLRWTRGGAPDASRAAFARYLETVFTYAGTTSLARDAARARRDRVAPGDFFVLAGHDGTGHAVLILDLAEDGRGHRRALLGQGFMPAQEFQVLAGPAGPWFSLDDQTVPTPFWAPFAWDTLRSLSR